MVNINILFDEELKNTGSIVLVKLDNILFGELSDENPKLQIEIDRQKFNGKIELIRKFSRKESERNFFKKILGGICFFFLAPLFIFDPFEEEYECYEILHVDKLEENSSLDIICKFDSQGKYPEFLTISKNCSISKETKYHISLEELKEEFNEREKMILVEEIACLILFGSLMLVGLLKRIYTTVLFPLLIITLISICCIIARRKLVRKYESLLSSTTI